MQWCGNRQSRLSRSDLDLAATAEQKTLMTQEEQDAILGRTLREYNDCRKELAAIEAKLASIGEELISLGKELKGRPEQVYFTGRSRNVRFGENRDTQNFSSASIDGNSIADLVT